MSVKDNKINVTVSQEKASDDLYVTESYIEEENVFAKKEDGPDFRGVSCFGAAILIAKSQIGLGLLGLPLTLHSLGFVPGLICLCGLCFLTIWTGIVVGDFRLAHPQVHSIGDATYLMFGRGMAEVVGGSFWLFSTLTYGAGVLGVSIGFNAITEHPTCTVVWVVVGAVVSFILGTFTRTMKVLSWAGYIALITLVSSVWMVAIACLTQSVPAAVPEGEPVDKMIRVVGTGIPFRTIASAVGTQVLSLCGTGSFFTIHSEMRDQKKYTKSLLMGQGFVVLNYIVIGSMVYGKVGRYVTSPALGSAGPLMKKIGYGIALPGLFFSCFFQAHLAAKYAFVRILKGSDHLQSNTKTHWFTWVGMMAIVIAIGFVVAGAIPFFDDLLSLIGSLLGTSFCLIIPAFMALHELGDESRKRKFEGLKWFPQALSRWNQDKRTMVITLLAAISIIGGVYISITGLYGSIASIAEGYANGSVDRAFSCADNSG